MLVSHLVRGVAIIAVVVLESTGGLHLWTLYAVSVLFGAADAFFFPASNSILPSLVKREDLPRANAITVAAENGARLLGPAAAGALIATVGTAPVLIINALTFFLAATTVLAAPKRAVSDAGQKPTHPRIESARHAMKDVLSDAKDGMTYVGRSKEMLAVAALISAATLSYSGLFAVGLPALARSFPDGPVVLGVLLSAWAFGQLAGTIAASITGLPRRWGLFVIAMTAWEGVTFLVIGFTPTYVLAAILLAVLGIGVAYSSDVAMPTFIQAHTPERLLGRVNSALEMPRVVLEPASLAVMGFLAAIGIAWPFVFAAVPLLLLSLIMGLSSVTRKMSLTSDTPTDTNPGESFAV
jgi:hypothetical protein